MHCKRPYLEIIKPSLGSENVSLYIDIVLLFYIYWCFDTVALIHFIRKQCFTQPGARSVEECLHFFNISHEQTRSLVSLMNRLSQTESAVFELCMSSVSLKNRPHPAPTFKFIIRSKSLQQYIDVVLYI